MATMRIKLIFSILVPIFFEFSASLADLSPDTPISPETACSLTRYPDYCKSMLPSNSHATMYDYGRFCIDHSISMSRKFLSLINSHLQHSSKLSNPEIQALTDCQFLAELNFDFLITSSNATSNVNATLPIFQADDIHTLLSAVLTNQQTCMDGLEAVSSTDSLHEPLYNGTKLYSVSLALYAKSWVPKTRNGTSLKHRRKQLLFRHAGRRLLQLGMDQANVSSIVVVSQDGSGDYATISDAVAAAPNNTDGTTGYFLIYVVAGVYEEYVSIAKYQKYIMMIGDGINRTVITGNRSVADGWTTFNCGTFITVGRGFVAMGITFRNTAGPSKGQAVAVRNGADMSTFYSCSIEGYQDTLYAHSLRQFYRECDIFGTVDFIFGNAAVVFQDCNMYPRLPLPGQTNEITAQGRIDPNQNTGTSIHNCTITASPELASSNGTTQTFLGRPWKLYSRTIYMQSFMDSLIDPAGWNPWDGDFALNTSYFAELNNSGPGSITLNRVTWPAFHIINATDAQNFTLTNFILGDYWLPLTGVPHFDGLL